MAPNKFPAPELVEDDVSSRIGDLFRKYVFMCWGIRKLQQYHAQTGAALPFNITETGLKERIARIYHKVA